MRNTSDPNDPTTPPYDPAAVARARDVLKAVPDMIGRYRILEGLGGGGMGEVYRAEQRTPVRREVAIKLIKMGMDTKVVIARFEAERQALAMMDHPNIAKVYDADADTAGRPYFVMEYVKGKPITEYADANHLTIRERLTLFEQVCNAVQHAHQKGIIHRDLKPSNVLVSTQDGKPHAKVIDFGIAKATNQRLTDMTLYTQHDQFIGTPQYMSPEQADGSLDIDTRTDVYSLGVLLYELLTGTTPFALADLKAAAMDRVKQLIREVDPPRPSTRLSMSASTLPSLAASRRVEPKKLGALVRGELDWIVMRALEKDRARRYETPTGFAEDVERYLNGLPVEAAPPSAWYRTRKLMRKYRAPLTAGALVVALLLLGLAGTAIGLVQARRAVTREREATARESTARQDAQLQAYEANISAAQAAMTGESWPEARQHLDDCPENLRGWEWKLLRTQAAAPAFGFPQAAESCQITPDGKYLLIVNGRDADLIDLATRKRTATFTAKWPSKKLSETNTLTSAARPALAADGRVAVQNEQTIAIHSPAGEKIAYVELKDAHDIQWLRLSPSGAYVIIDRLDAAGSTWRTTEVYAPDGSGGKPIATLASNATPNFAADDTSLLHYVYKNDEWNVVRLGDGPAKPVVSLGKLNTQMIWSAHISPDGRTVVSGSRDGVITVIDAHTGKALRAFPAGGKRIDAMTLSADGTRAATLEDDGRHVSVWDLDSGKLLASRVLEPFADYEGGGCPIAIQDDRVILWGGHAIWDWAAGDAADALRMPAQQFNTRCASAGAKTIVSVDNSRVRVWDAGTIGGQPSMLAGLDRDADAATPLPCGRFGGAEVAMDDWGDVAADAIRVNLERSARPTRAATFVAATDGRWTATVIDDHSILVNDARTHATLATLAQHEGRVTALAVTPDGTRLVSGSDDCTVRFWDTAGWRQVAVDRRNRGVTDLEFTADNTRLVVGFADKTIESWDRRDGMARQRERVERDAEARRQAPFVRSVIDGPVAWNELAHAILTDNRLGDAQKLGALANLNQQLAGVQAAAYTIAARLERDYMLPSRIKVAIAAEPGLSPATLKVIERGVAGWSPSAATLNTLAWSVVIATGKTADSYAAALEVAEASVKANPDEHSSYNTYVLALYRCGQYEKAIEAAAKASAIGGVQNDQTRPGAGALANDDAIAAMALQRLGRTDEAKARIRRPVRVFGVAGDRKLLAEATGMVDPASTQPSTRPVSAALRSVRDAIDANDVEGLSKHLMSKGSIKGRIAKILPTSRRNAYNVFFEPAESAAMIWIPPAVAAKIDEASIQGLIGSEVVVSGKLVPYGGKDPSFEGRPQVEIELLEDIRKITPATSIGSAERPATQPTQPLDP